MSFVWIELNAAKNAVELIIYADYGDKWLNNEVNAITTKRKSN